MKTIKVEVCCPECESAIVDDIHNGERICSSCGIVVDEQMADYGPETKGCLLYTSPSPRDGLLARMPSSA